MPSTSPLGVGARCLDLTSDQFLPGEEVVGGTVVVRPPDGPRYHREQYELLRRRVLASLATPS